MELAGREPQTDLGRSRGLIDVHASGSRDSDGDSLRIPEATAGPLLKVMGVDRQRITTPTERTRSLTGGR